jgi:hypothetical protein
MVLSNDLSSNRFIEWHIDLAVHCIDQIVNDSVARMSIGDDLLGGRIVVVLCLDGTGQFTVDLDG